MVKTKIMYRRVSIKIEFDYNIQRFYSEAVMNRAKKGIEELVNFQMVCNLRMANIIP